MYLCFSQIMHKQTKPIGAAKTRIADEYNKIFEMKNQDFKRMTF